MMTDREKEQIKQMRDALLESVVQFYGEDVTPEIKAEFVGTNMAHLDALFAIREGESWRGLTDPKEIARELLRIGQLGE